MNRTLKNKIRKRWKESFAMIFFVILLLMAKLAYIQVYCGETFLETATRQQVVGIIGADKRGVIYDRNLVPMTGTNKEYVYILKENKNSLDKIDDIFNAIGAKRILANTDNYYIYSADSYNKYYSEMLVDNYDAYILECNSRYDDNQRAAHIIGYINQYDNKGVAGIEEQLNDLISSVDRKTFVYADRNGRILPGAGCFQSEKGESEDIILTIDARIQDKVEEILECEKQNCAVVVSEANSGEILAMASTPTYNPNNIKEYVESNREELVNKATQGEYPPGSTFKIIVAAAAIENGIVDLDSKFICSGKECCGDIEIGCFTGGDKGHGEITLEEAFAYSCNCAFIQLGKKIGNNEIIKMAEKMGLGTKSINDISNISKGNITSEEVSRGAGIGNLSIGQGDLLVTPLQMARVINIIINDGMDIELSLIKNSDKIAEVSSVFSKHYKGRSITNNIMKNDTSEQLRKMMEATATYGSASKIKDISFAGKTGSAEDGNEIHGWFVGYMPTENPKYSIVVFVENGKSGSSSAVPIFAKIAKVLENL